MASAFCRLESGSGAALVLVRTARRGKRASNCCANMVAKVGGVQSGSRCQRSYSAGSVSKDAGSNEREKVVERRLCGISFDRCMGSLLYHLSVRSKSSEIVYVVYRIFTPPERGVTNQLQPNYTSAHGSTAPDDFVGERQVEHGGLFVAAAIDVLCIVDLDPHIHQSRVAYSM
jgi:hypothetical protein